MNWFYESNGQPRGPISDAELDQLIAKGEVTPTTLVWREGLANWQPLQSVRPSTEASTPGSAAEPPPADAVKCDSCGRFVSPSEIIQIGERAICATCKPAVLQQIQQSGGVTMLGETRNGPAWEHREQIGYVKAAWETIMAIVKGPTRAFETMKREGGLQAPFLFAFLLGVIIAELGIVERALLKVMGLLPTVDYSQNPFLRDNPVFQMLAGEGWEQIVATALLQPIFISLGLFISGGVFHLSLMLCARIKQPFETTFRAVSYTDGATKIVGLVSILIVLLHSNALLVAFGFGYIIWYLVLLCIALAKAHEIDTGRAVLSVLLPIFVCCCVVFLFAIVFGIVAGHALNNPRIQ